VLGEALAAAREGAQGDPEMVMLSERLGTLHHFVDEFFRGVGLVLEEEEALLHYLLSLSPRETEELRQVLRLALDHPEEGSAK
jgi:hypothetical protein